MSILRHTTNNFLARLRLIYGANTCPRLRKGALSDSVATIVLPPFLLAYMQRDLFTHGLIALVFTATFAPLAWYAIGAPDLVGIDDAAITRNYAENIAAGHGFVFNIGGERVEGATSLLWTGLIAIIYLLPVNDAVAILTLTYVITAGAVALYLTIASQLALRLGGTARAGLFAAVLLLIGLPDFLVWSVFSMMETALWSLMLTLLILRLIRQTDSDPPDQRDPWLVLAACAMPLTRPEGVAMAAGLIVLAMTLRGGPNRALIAALLTTIGTCVAAVAFRLWYFGYPMPNTYYAKVSSDRVQNIVDGAKYLADFLFARPFADFGAVACATMLTLAVLQPRREWAKAITLLACTVFGVLAVYVVLGGDHFTLWRLYLPILPLLILLAGVAMQSQLPRIAGWRGTMAAAAGLTLYLGLSWLFLYQNRADVAKEYDLTAKGIAFGNFLNTVEPPPKLGVIAAGGIALSYEGAISDLMGLNWTVMAHANPVKEGYRNHASFDASTFYQHPPDLIALFTRDTCQDDNWSEPRASSGPMKGIVMETQFQQMYQPVVLRDGATGCWNGYARRTWLDQTSEPRILPRNWADLTLG